MIDLIPFSSHGEKITLKGDLRLLSPLSLEVAFFLLDPGQVVEFPPRTKSSEPNLRAHELWRHTCYECFFARPGESAYWELNLSFDRKWNLYRFKNYREPQPPEESHDFSLTEFSPGERSVHAVLTSRIPLQSLEFSLCAVLKTQNQVLYYSTAHAGDKPDFHLRQSFTEKRGIP